MFHQLRKWIEMDRNIYFFVCNGFIIRESLVQAQVGPRGKKGELQEIVALFYFLGAYDLGSTGFSACV
jgi:hypothetical protein